MQRAISPAIAAAFTSGYISAPAINRVLHEGITGSHWVMLKDCSHLSHVEDPQGYMGAVLDFLAQVETRTNHLKQGI
jgi:pimeloyl-ACP methyl ester carboxylesterase